MQFISYLLLLLLALFFRIRVWWCCSCSLFEWIIIDCRPFLNYKTCVYMLAQARMKWITQQHCELRVFNSQTPIFCTIFRSASRWMVKSCHPKSVWNTCTLSSSSIHGTYQWSIHPEHTNVECNFQNWQPLIFILKWKMAFILT